MVPKASKVFSLAIALPSAILRGGNQLKACGVIRRSSHSAPDCPEDSEVHYSRKLPDAQTGGPTSVRFNGPLGKEAGSCR